MFATQSQKADTHHSAASSLFELSEALSCTHRRSINTRTALHLRTRTRAHNYSQTRVF